MSNRVFNFSAGPAMLPAEVLEASAKALVDFQGKGFGIAECSHRGKEFDGVLDEAIAQCKSLLVDPRHARHPVPAGWGDAALQHHPDELPERHRPTTSSAASGRRRPRRPAQGAYGEKIRVIATSESTNFDRPPTGWTADPNAAYLHVCSNETVHGHRLVEWPEHPNLVVDASSEMMSRPHPIARTALVYAGAQKNLGPAGVVLTIVRKDLYDRIGKSVPKIFSFKALAEAKSCLNTPPTFGVYFLLETFRWLEGQGGLAAIEKRNAEKAELVYDAIDGVGRLLQGHRHRQGGAQPHERDVPPAQRGAHGQVRQGRVEERHGGAQGLPHRRRHPRLDLQRHAGRRRQGPGRLHGHLRQSQRVTPSRARAKEKR